MIIMLSGLFTLKIHIIYTVYYDWGHLEAEDFGKHKFAISRDTTKPRKCHVRLAKTQISLDTRPA